MSYNMQLLLYSRDIYGEWGYITLIKVTPLSRQILKHNRQPNGLLMQSNTLVTFKFLYSCFRGEETMKVKGAETLL